MKNPNFIVRIPEPCHEDWNSMLPDEKGKFCNSCSKSVFDFSTKTDTEIKDILVEYKDQKVCGHFKKSQVNRPLNISINLKDLPKNISMTKAFAIALFLVFGTFLFSCTDANGQKVNEIEVNESELIVPLDPQNFTVGSMLFDVPPQIDSLSETCTMISGDTIITINEEHIDGGISFEEVVDEVTDIEEATRDTLIYNEPMVLGMMVIPYIETDSSLVTPKDSVEVVNSRKMNSIESSIKSKELVIFPNPSNGEFTINYLVKKRTHILLAVLDMKGVLIKIIVDVPNQHEGKYQIPINLNELPNGIYLVTLIKGAEKFVERLVIER